MVDMHDKSKGRRIFHVNMLKGFNDHRSAKSNYSVEEGSEGCLDGVQIFLCGTRSRR